MGGWQLSRGGGARARAAWLWVCVAVATLFLGGVPAPRPCSFSLFTQRKRTKRNVPYGWAPTGLPCASRLSRARHTGRPWPAWLVAASLRPPCGLILLRLRCSAAPKGVSKIGIRKQVERRPRCACADLTFLGPGDSRRLFPAVLGPVCPAEYRSLIGPGP